MSEGGTGLASGSRSGARRGRSLRARLTDTLRILLEPVVSAATDVRNVLVERHGPLAEKILSPLGVWAFFLTFAGQAIRNTVGWWWFAAIAALSGVVLAAAFITAGRTITWRRIPISAAGFALWCSMTTLWSQYPLETVAASMLMLATTATGILIAIAFPLKDLMKALTRAMKIILALSLALEVGVALSGVHALAPLYMWDWPHIPPSYYWVMGDIFNGGPIQGIVGNRNPLAFIALLALICVVVTWLAERTHGVTTVVWIAVSVLVLALTGSATVHIATLACAIALGAAWWLKSMPAERRPRAMRILVAIASFLLVVALLMHQQFTQLFGRSSDLTGRGEIWMRVINLWTEHPIGGWGWIMYWVPWIPMFRTLVVRPDGSPTMSAHNAYVEALFQTGIIGVVILVIGVVVVVRRSFRAARYFLDVDLYPLMPALIVVALVVQSLTESRLISEGNWVLFTAIATWLAVRVDITGPVAPTAVQALPITEAPNPQS